jgi:hypothetical protein
MIGGAIALLAKAATRRTPHELATLGYARTGTVNGRCQSPPGCLQSRYIGVELFKLSFRHYGPTPRCFPFSLKRGQKFSDLSNFKARLLCRTYYLQLAHGLAWIIAAR